MRRSSPGQGQGPDGRKACDGCDQFGTRSNRVTVDGDGWQLHRTCRDGARFDYAAGPGSARWQENRQQREAVWGPTPQRTPDPREPRATRRARERAERARAEGWTCTWLVDGKPCGHPTVWDGVREHEQHVGHRIGEPFHGRRDII